MSAKIYTEINMDFNNIKYILVNAKQYDSKSRYIKITCYDDNKLIKLAKNANSAFIRYSKSDGFGVFNTCEITDDGKIIVELTEQMLAVSGTSIADVMIVDNENGNPTVDDAGSVVVPENSSVISTMNFYVNVIENPLDNSQVESTYEFSALNDLLEKANVDYERIITLSKQYADSAKNSETLALQYSNNAKDSETKAYESETNAYASATSAESSKQSSERYAIESKSYAVGGTTSRDGEDTDNAKYYKEQANSYEQEALLHKNDIEEIKTNIDLLKESIDQSERNAKISENNSKLSENNAKSSELNAKESETNASTKADEASLSAQNASESEANSLNYSLNAKNSETNSKVSEQNAKVSEQNANDSAENAKESETISIEKANESLLSAKNAKQSEDNIKAYDIKSEEYAKQARSYAVGDTDYRENEITDNAKYYYQQVKQIGDGLSGALFPMGTITFEELKNQTKQKGYMYNISNDFVSDDTFKDGGGITYSSGTNVYYTADGYWDCLTGTMISGIKGNAETDYRTTGNINITPDDIGSYNKAYVDALVERIIELENMLSDINSHTYLIID